MDQMQRLKNIFENYGIYTGNETNEVIDLDSLQYSAIIIDIEEEFDLLIREVPIMLTLGDFDYFISNEIMKQNNETK